MTKNNEEVFVPNLLPYFKLYIDKGNYIGYKNLRGITKVPNKKFTEIQPMRGTYAELPKYKYSYRCPIYLLNNMTNTSSQITASNLTTDILMIDLHDWREMDNIVKLRQGDNYTHIWNNQGLLMHTRQLHNTRTDDVHSEPDDVRNQGWISNSLGWWTRHGNWTEIRDSCKTCRG